MSFTPCSSRGVNRTTPSQKALCRGMTSFNFRTAVRLCPGAPADAPRTLSATAPATGQTRLLAVLTLRTRIRPISLPTRQQKQPFSRKTMPCRFPIANTGNLSVNTAKLQTECRCRWTWSSHFWDEVPGRFGCFRNLNRTLGPTRPILSFTPFLGHGVNCTTPSQKSLCWGMPSFNFRMAVLDTSLRISGCGGTLPELRRIFSGIPCRSMSLLQIRRRT